MIGTLTWDIRVGDTTLPAEVGNLSIDDQNIPAITASVTVPFDEDLLPLLDPRTTDVPRVMLHGQLTEWASVPLSAVSAYTDAAGGTIASLTTAWSGLELADVSAMFGAPLHPSAAAAPTSMALDLHVRELTHDDWEMNISLASDEALLTDWAPTSAGDVLPMNNETSISNRQQVATWVNPVIGSVLGYRLTPGPYDTAGLSATWSDLIDWTVWTSAWDMFRPAIEDTDLKLRVGPTGRGFTLLRPEDAIRDQADHAFQLTSADVISARPVYSRNGDWYDSALLRRPDGTGTRGSPNPGTHSRTYIEAVPDTVKPSYAMAQNIARRSANRGRFIDIVAPIRLDVFMTDEFTYLPDGATAGPDYEWRVKSVSYDFLAGTMNLRGERRY